MLVLPHSLNWREAKEILDRKPELRALCEHYLDLFFVETYFAVQTKYGYNLARKNLFDKDSELTRITPEAIACHLFGLLTLGVYCPSRRDTVKWMAIDFDNPLIANGTVSQEQGLRDLQPKVTAMNRSLQAMGLETVLEFSGFKGYHIFVFFDGEAPAGKVYAVMQNLVKRIAPGTETFPKQATLQGIKYGNLMKLPLALHKKSGQRSCLIDENFEPLPQQMSRVIDIPRNSVQPIIKAHQEIVNTRLKSKAQMARFHQSPEEQSANPLDAMIDPQWVAISPGTRNRRQYKFVSICRDKGLSKEQARKEAEVWLKNNEGNYTTSYDAALADVNRCIDQVYSKPRV